MNSMYKKKKEKKVSYIDNTQLIVMVEDICTYAINKSLILLSIMKHYYMHVYYFYLFTGINIYFISFRNRDIRLQIKPNNVNVSISNKINNQTTNLNV